MRATHLLAAAFIGSGLLALPVAAQASQCTDIQKILLERKSVVERIQGLGKKKIDPATACNLFTKLVANGQSAVKFVDANKDWCQIPDNFAEGIKQDHERSTKIKAQACTVAAKQAQMMRQARQAQQQGGPQQGGLFGGPGLTGQYRIPSGAL